MLAQPAFHGRLRHTGMTLPAIGLGVLEEMCLV
jgi:hypothetical protein